MHKKEYQPLTAPHLEWNKEASSSTFGQLVAEPLEPGFGVTFGNALRRILLGSIEGSAVTSVIVKGINNEFSAIPGVIEDAMQLILNIKGILIKNTTGKPGVMHLRLDGEGMATVGDIVPDSHLELINKEHVLAHIAPNGSLDITFFVESGRGYQPARWPLGVALQDDDKIYLDATFSSVQTVTYDVEKTRVGRDIDYDKLTLSVTTNGTEAPADVVHYAVSVMRTQLEYFLSVPEIAFNALNVSIASESASPKLTEMQERTINGVPLEFFAKPIEALELSVRAQNCLVNAGIKRIIDLVTMTEDELLQVKNFGRKSRDEVLGAMKTFGLTFGMHVSESDLEHLTTERE